jgi:uncharacterized UBP type Zn finger protein
MSISDTLSERIISLDSFRDAVRSREGESCPACGRSIGSEASVEVQGRVFHSTCAIYRPRGGAAA